MAAKSKIEWTETTWNPVTGCTSISAGCDHCYARRMAKRLKAMGREKYANEFQVTIHEKSLEEPLRWKKPHVIFTCSMGDLFHEDVPLDFIQRAFQVMKQANQHIFQVLTKRSGRLRQLSDKLPWSPHIWMGVTVERDDCLFRIDDLRTSTAAVKFLSLEPLLGPLPNLDLTGIDWVIVGGESGPGARPMKKEWVIDIMENCQRCHVPFFFKQWGGVNKKRAGRLLDGRSYSEVPDGMLDNGYQSELELAKS